MQPKSRGTEVIVGIAIQTVSMVVFPP